MSRMRIGPARTLTVCCGNVDAMRLDTTKLILTEFD